MLGKLISKLENKYVKFYIYGSEYPSPVFLLGLVKKLPHNGQSYAHG